MLEVLAVLVLEYDLVLQSIVGSASLAVGTGLLGVSNDDTGEDEGLVVLLVAGGLVELLEISIGEVGSEPDLLVLALVLLSVDKEEEDGGDELGVNLGRSIGDQLQGVNDSEALAEQVESGDNLSMGDLRLDEVSEEWVSEVGSEKLGRDLGLTTFSGGRSINRGTFASGIGFITIFILSAFSARISTAGRGGIARAGSFSASSVSRRSLRPLELLNDTSDLGESTIEIVEDLLLGVLAEVGGLLGISVGLGPLMERLQLSEEGLGGSCDGVGLAPLAFLEGTEGGIGGLLGITDIGDGELVERMEISDTSSVVVDLEGIRDSVVVSAESGLPRFISGLSATHC